MSEEGDGWIYTKPGGYLLDGSFTLGTILADKTDTARSVQHPSSTELANDVQTSDEAMDSKNLAEMQALFATWAKDYVLPAHTISSPTTSRSTYGPWEFDKLESRVLSYSSHDLQEVLRKVVVPASWKLSESGQRPYMVEGIRVAKGVRRWKCGYFFVPERANESKSTTEIPADAELLSEEWCEVPDFIFAYRLTLVAGNGGGGGSAASVPRIASTKYVPIMPRPRDRKSEK